jgi:hypothetical protein
VLAKIEPFPNCQIVAATLIGVCYTDVAVPTWPYVPLALMARLIAVLMRVNSPPTTSGR